MTTGYVGIVHTPQNHSPIINFNSIIFTSKLNVVAGNINVFGVTVRDVKKFNYGQFKIIYEFHDFLD